MRERQSLRRTVSLLALLIWGLAGTTLHAQDVKVEGRQLLVDFDHDGQFEPFIVKGVGYSPYPVTRHPSDWGWPEPDDPRMDNILADLVILERDMTLIEGMNANTIRLWKGDDTEQEDGRYPVKLTEETLDMAQAHNLKVIPGFWIGSATEKVCTPHGWDYTTLIDFTDPAVRIDILGRFLEFVDEFKDHPAVLFWAVGNENNYSLGDDPAQVRAFYSLVDEMADMAHQVEGADHHPVALVNGDLQYIGDPAYGAGDADLSHLDIWGVNVYRGESFGGFFADYAGRSVKPLWVAEYGIDAWHTSDPENPDNGYEDQQAQAAWTGGMWNEIASNTDVAVGGTVMEYSDEWWKPGEWFCGEDSDICNASQDHFGFGAADFDCPPDGIVDWTPAFPDGFINSEWFGLVSIEPNPVPYGPDVVSPRQVYTTLQDLLPNTAPQIVSQPPATVIETMALFAYDVQAVDPDNDNLTYVLDEGPSGAVVNAATGLIQWTPGVSDVGTHSVTVRAQDPSGAYDLQGFTLTVVADADNVVVLYGDGTLVAGADILVWSDDPAAIFDGIYIDPTAPEGDETFFTSADAWAGWGIFYTGGSQDLTGMESWLLKFWVKTPADLKVGMKDAENSHEMLISALGWDGSNTWQEITVPVADLNVDFTRVEAPFMITSPGAADYYVDYARLALEDGNSDPVITSTPVTAAVAGQEYTYDVQADDPDNDTMVYSLLQAPEGMIVNRMTGLVSWTPAAGQSGEFPVTVYVSDTRGGSDSQSYTLVVEADESRWVVYDDDGIPAGTDIYVWQESSGAVFNGDYVDPTAPEGVETFLTTSVTWAGWGVFYTGGPENLSARVDNLVTFWVKTPVDLKVGLKDSTQAEERYISSYGWDGTSSWQQISIAVTDFGVNLAQMESPFMVTAEQAATFYVDYVRWVEPSDNQPPVITSVPVTSATAGSTYSYNVDADDPDGDTLIYSLVTKPAGMAISTSSGLILWNPTEAEAGDHAVSVMVSDGKGGSDTQDYILTVSVPEEPYLRIYTDNGIAADSDIFMWAGDMSASVFDANYVEPSGDAPEGDEVFLTSSPTWAGWGVFFNTDRDLRDYAGWQLKFSVKTSVDLKVGLQIDGGKTEFYISEFGWNGANVWQSLVIPVSAFGLALNQVESPFLITAEAGTVFYVDYVRWEESGPNTPPEITSIPVTEAAAEELYLYDVEAEDADGDTLTYSLLEKPEGMAISSATGMILWNPDEEDAGIHPVTVKVTDGQGGADIQAYDLTVSAEPPDNHAPEITDGPEADDDEILENTTTEVSVAAFDPDGDALDYDWSTTGGSITGTGAVVTYLAPKVRRDTTYTVSVDITDGRGGSVSGSVDILVKNKTTGGRP